ncbi:hypothetical protein Tco_0659443, partial [Tanacetum coccineum]
DFCEEHYEDILPIIMEKVDLSSKDLNSVVLSSSKDRWTCDLSGDGEFK